MGVSSDAGKLAQRRIEFCDPHHATQEGAIYLLLLVFCDGLDDHARCGWRGRTRLSTSAGGICAFALPVTAIRGQTALPSQRALRSRNSGGSDPARISNGNALRLERTTKQRGRGPRPRPRIFDDDGAAFRRETDLGRCYEFALISRRQKSDLSARGTSASCPGYHWVFSAQACSSHGLGLTR